MLVAKSPAPGRERGLMRWEREEMTQLYGRLIDDVRFPTLVIQGLNHLVSVFLRSRRIK